jgi:hypothetical protein
MQHGVIVRVYNRVYSGSERICTNINTTGHYRTVCNQSVHTDTVLLYKYVGFYKENRRKIFYKFRQCMAVPVFIQ